MSTNNICGIVDKIGKRQYELSKHATVQSDRRNITISELEQALRGEIEVIEDYPDDKYGPSCLVLGYTDTGRPLHIQCSYPSRPLLKIITLYEPDTALWFNDRTRK